MRQRLVQLAHRLQFDALPLGLAEARTEQRDGIASPQLGHFRLRALVVTLAVRPEPDRAQDAEVRHRPLAHRGDGLAHRLPQGAHIGGVGLRRVDAERLGALEHVPGDRDRRRRRLRDAVVLQRDEQPGTPERGHVQRLVEDALPEGAVPDEDDDDARVATQPLRERDAESDRDELPLDAGADEARSVQVLAAAAAPTDAVCLAHQLGEQGCEVAAGGEKVTVAAVRAEDGVTGLQVAEQADRDRLLADRRMRRSREEPLRVELQELLLRTPDLEHPAVQLEVVDQARLRHAV